MDQGYCFVSISPVRAENRDQSEIVTQLLFGEVVTVQEIEAPWAKITSVADGYEGWIDLKHLKKLSDKEMRRWLEGLDYLTDRERLLETPWGSQWICRGSFIPAGLEAFNIGKDSFQWLQESSATFEDIWSCAESYLNTPYLWGGKSPFGIDCSGYTQAVYRFFNINLPRDASQQVLDGAEVDFQDIETGDLAFFHNDKGKITHVGILDNEGHILHASGHVRRDLFTKDGIVHNEHGDITHKLSIIKRW
ncbi:C40 family peptidase [Crocinitomicaceae bacterium]|nr:C40 family peptidase [Crocinitomicaceae bacterium]MDB3906492.1 C40 family peptidase [Crocinitomicaceae bacterium]